eukprot:5590292-Karenia_brevis.AAC.2
MGHCLMRCVGAWHGQLQHNHLGMQNRWAVFLLFTISQSVVSCGSSLGVISFSAAISACGKDGQWQGVVPLLNEMWRPDCSLL